MRANGMIKRALFLLAALTTMALPALAAEGAGEAPPSLFAGDIGNSVWTILIFGLVLAVLAKYAWGPILSTLQARESFIHEALAKAKRDRDEAEARLKQYEERLAGARAEASAIVEEGRRDADVVRHRIEAVAKAEADKMVERARREIHLATVTATRELYELSARLATSMAEHVLRRELTPEDHERLISDAIEAIGGEREKRAH
jgi:F-type H+-transporting ATPase subunit b